MFLGLGFPDPRPTSAPSSWPAQGSGPTSAFHPPVSRDLSHFPGSTFGAGASPTQNSGSIARHTPSYNPNHSAPATPTGRVSAGYFRDESDTDSDTSAIDARPASRTISSELPVVQTVGSTDQASTSDEPRPVVPRYGIRMSKTIPSQPKALDWQTTQGKVHFIEFEDEIFARWGQLRSHWSTCLLVCEDWRHSDPLDIMALFSPENMPPVGSPRAKYSYKDHGVSLARAKVWFEKLQRTAGDLDVLLNTGPFKPMDASHVCHHEHCIKHVVYEPAHINHDRQECCNRAKFLRSEGRDVPEHCTVHGPPCMMQHAAVTALEIYYQQFTILSQAHGLPPPVPPSKPYRYPYPTFEGRLPCRFPALFIQPNDLVSRPVSDKIRHRPKLTCDFCTQDVLRTFATIHGFWSHIVNKHQGVANDVRCAVIQESGTRWSLYWELYSEGGKRRNSTWAKLERIKRAGFCWSDVLDWSLRWG